MAVFDHLFVGSVWRSLSLKTRVVLLVVVLLIAGIWGLAARVTAVLHADLEKVLSDQLLATVGYVAADIDSNIKLRFDTLHEIAASITAEILADPAKVQHLLEQRRAPAALFPTGVFAADRRGMSIADYPRVAGRTGAFIGDREYFREVISDRESAVSAPLAGRFAKQPVIAFAVPLREVSGTPVGALVAAGFPSDPMLFGQIEGTRIGKTGFFLVASPKERVFVSATDKSRILQPVPATGVNPLFDRRMKGFEGAGVVTSSLGVEVLTASRNMRTTGWIVIAAIPTEEAFAPIATLKRQIYLAALLISLLVAVMLRLSLARQLAPLAAAGTAMRRVTEGKEPFAPLPVVRDDEIGALLANFNRLMAERGRLETALRASEERFRDLAALSSDWYWEQDANLRFSRMSEELYPKTRLRPESTLGKLRWELPIVGVSEEQWRAHRALLERREPFADFVYQMVNESGERRWFAINGKPLFGANGEFLGYRGTGRDITEYRRAEAELRRHEEHARILFDSLPLAVGHADRDLRITFVNRRYRTIYGAVPDPVGRTVRAVLGEERYAIMGQHMRRALAGEDVEFEASFVRGDATPGTRWVRYIPERDAAGRVAGFFALIEDITERKRAETVLATKTKVLTATLENMAQGLSMMDGDLRLLAWNRRFIELYELPEELFRGPLTLEDLFRYNARRGEYGPGDPEEQVRTRLELARRGEPHLFERTRANGTVLEIRGQPMPGGGFVTTYTDITQRKAAEAELLRLNAELEQRVAQRTAELERANRELEAFTYSVSHDLRSPLRAIKGFSEIVLAENAAKLDRDAVDYLQKVVSAGQRMGLIIDDLLALSRVSRQEVKRRNFDFSAMAAEVAASLAQAQPEPNVRVSVKPDMTLDADPGLLRIVLENLIGNAWKFSSHSSDALIEVGSEEREGDSVYFVRDNGAGFDMERAHELFKPFQRLHSDKDFEGTGIGLSIVQRIVTRHGGGVWAEGAMGRGATFYFTTKPDAQAQRPPP